LPLWETMIAQTSFMHGINDRRAAELAGRRPGAPLRCRP
jgi:hypothetical protein